MKIRFLRSPKKGTKRQPPVMREMIRRMLRQVRKQPKNKPPLVWRLESDSKIFY
ncbi:hypothetical protein [Microcystis aeruginosa]|uniref:hypothetical protein n=1 Tax=Microcystis aeruginosa TaxID=1126 RepID=UPI001293E4D0|nr:hypothetical protein [Microcystis aeruginosa]